ncbi:MAG: nucleotidyltransferase family protein [Phycisphaerales bacterium]|jgi:predicted nucleotidyltransferase|nr:nucleotidyltransferase family protein [Phycisphaerales bacterium]
MGQIPIPLPMDRIAEFCQRNGIRRLALFGSVLRDDFTPQSDVDVLVEFEPSARVSLFDLGGMSVELSQIFGRQVDLRTPEDLSRYFRGSVLREAMPLYAA